METIQTQHESKRKLLQSAVHVIRSKGYTATTVEDVCETASLTKGSFFHHFKTKEDLALSAMDLWNAVSGELFSGAAYRSLPDPLERVLAYVDFRKALLKGELPGFTCLAGTMVQEIYATHPAIREACDQSISGHAATLEPDIAEAMEKYGVAGGWTAESLALHTQAVFQGAFVLAKAKGGAAVAEECVDHLRHYLVLLFQKREGTGSPNPGAAR